MKLPKLVILLLLTGCASGVDVSSLPEVPQGYARLVVVRSFTIPGFPQGVEVKLDDREIFRLSVGETEYVDIPAAESCLTGNPVWHELEASTWLIDKRLNFCVQPGETRTFLTGYNWTGGTPVGAASVPTGQFGLEEKIN